MRALLFLARRAYRQRRLTDAVRVLPFLGGFLFLLPVFWRPEQTAEPDTGFGGLYLFSAWAGLIVLAAVLARRLGRSADGDDPADSEGGGG